MSKDVKIEVIYFKCSNDISIEFGLHGDYPVRMLTSVCNNLNSFFSSLKRAVSRSEIIVTVGGYEENEYLPKYIASAISRTCYTPDYRSKSIIAKENYLLPKGAIPLAPSSRLFGGFLIESGPQAIISLTEDKKVRLEVVNNFVVDYITEHYNVYNSQTINTEIENKDSIANAEEIANEGIVLCTALDENKVTVNELPTDFEDVSSNTIDTPTAVVEDVDIFNIPDENVEECDETLNTQETNVEDINTQEQNEPSPTVEPIVPTSIPSDKLLEIDTGLILTDDDDLSISKPRRRYRAKRLICVILSLIVILSSIAYLIIPKLCNKTTQTNNNTINHYANFQKLFNSYNGDKISAFNALQNINRDINMWLSVENTEINYPVVSVSDGASEEYYLSHLPDGNKNTVGSVFVYDKSITNTSPSVVSGNKYIYSSAESEGAFCSLVKFYNSPSSCIDKKITVQDRYSTSQWQIFSVFKNSDVGNWNYVKSSFSNLSDYMDYLSRLIAVSICKSNISLTGSEPIILLIGITGNEKYIVAAALSESQLHQSEVSIPSLNSSTPSSSETSSIESTASNTSSEENGEEDHEENPIESEIVLPALPPINTPSSKPSTTSSEVVLSSPSHTVSSSSVVSSTSTTSQFVSSIITSNIVSSNTSSIASSTNSSSATTSISSSLPSAGSSSNASSQPTPGIDPIYTWDIQLSIIDKKTGIKYTKDAVEIVAMIIEIEMSPTIDPKEAVKAQAVAAYNWLLNNGAKDPNTAPKVSMQLPLTKQAIEYANEAKGMLVLYDDTIAKTNYYAYSAGKTACTQDIWGGKAYPYLQSVDCSVDETLKDFITTKTYSADEIQNLIKEKCGIDVSNMPKKDWLVPVEYDKNGVYCRYINIGGTVYMGKYLRGTLLSNGIRSTAYTIEYNESDDTFIITCKGYGHGVGMSQRGAKAYAKQGWSCEQILKHFFPETTIIKNGLKQE